MDTEKYHDIEKLRALSAEIDRLFEEGKQEQGFALLQEAVERSRSVDHAYELFFQGELAGYGKDYERQRTLFQEALSLRPDDYFLLRSLGVCFSCLGEEDKAITLFDQALSVNPQDFDSLRQKGVSYSKKGDMDKAIELYDQALSLNPQDFRSLRNKGVAYSKKGEEDKAIELYDQALSLNPQDFDSLRQKGVSYSKKGEEDKAIALFDQALSLNPQDFNSLRNKGVALFNSGRKAEAVVQCFKEAIEYGLDRAEGEALIDYVLSQTKGASGTGLGSIMGTVERVREGMEGCIGRFLESIAASERKINAFLSEESNFRSGQTLFFLLRKWNSYTPSIPGNDERSLGGGYFLLHDGQGIVVDPGYNFLENFEKAGGKITDIHTVVLTHAHNDHTMDFESILTLVHKYNSDKKLKPGQPGYKELDLYINTGALTKFPSFLNLRSDNVHVLMPGHEYELGTGLNLTVLPAYHDEMVSKKYAVGLKFEFSKGEERKTLVITSDTGLYPRMPDGERVDTTKKEIWEKYGIEPGTIDLLIPHLGSIKKREFQTELKDTSPEALGEVFYPNHLGMLGVVRVIAMLRPRLAVVSEFGEELRTIQVELVNMMRKVVQGLFGEGEEVPRLVPGDLSFIYDVFDARFYCVKSKELKGVDSIVERTVSNDKPEFYYYAEDGEPSDPGGAFTDWVKAFEKAQGDKTLFYFKSEEQG